MYNISHLCFLKEFDTAAGTITNNNINANNNPNVVYEDPSDNQEAEETKTKFMENLKVTRNDF